MASVGGVAALEFYVVEALHGEKKDLGSVLMKFLKPTSLKPGEHVGFIN